MMVDLFSPGDSFLHRFDPRVKLLMVVPLCACFFTAAPVWVLLPEVLLLVLVVLLALGPRELARPFAAIGPVLLLIALLTPPFHRGGIAYLRIAGWPILTSEGVDWTVRLLARFAGITLACVAVLRSIDLDHLVLSLRWFGLRYDLCLVVVIAFRFIPSLGATWRNVLDAHRLRSSPEELQSRRGRSAQYLPALTSVLVEAVKGIPALAMALESRGFGRSNPRTSYLQLKGGGPLVLDAVVGALVCALLLAAAFARWPSA